MDKDAFIKLHGQEAWVQLVKDKQDMFQHAACDICRVRATNANAIAHHDIIGMVLRLLGFGTLSLLEAREICQRSMTDRVPNVKADTAGLDEPLTSPPVPSADTSPRKRKKPS